MNEQDREGRYKEGTSIARAQLSLVHIATEHIEHSNT